jgi:hypothetical protein
MGDPISVSLALGVAGNLATNVVQSLGDRIEDTRAGRALAKVGLLKPGFEARLKAALQEATVNFLEENPLYGLPEVHSFLESKSFARDLREMLLEQRGLDAEKVMSRLETYIGFPLSEAPESWPNRIDPQVFVQSLFNALTGALGRQADEGVLWIGIAVAQQGLSLRKISTKLDIIIDNQARFTSEPTAKLDENFRISYLEHLVGRAQKLSTPGARDLRGINQSLSVAYISLNLKSATGAEAVRAEDFLSQNSHVAIRGPAGSGKTTLLNWLITKCSPEKCGDDDKWGGYIPFFVPLRKVARLHSGPPTLDRLVEYSVDNKLWTLDTPPGWINAIVAKQKRAIIMIDGVDELPPSRRVEFWDWLADFVSEYPENRVIVTSRALPGAPSDGSANEQWNPPKLFMDAQLQDMSDSDVTSFVNHWHDAIDPTKLDEQELSSLAEARAALPAKLEDAANRRIRELCNTPLLCAMICVLHWKEEGYLPRQRVEVYERCCDMLIEARDHKRGVESPPGPISAMSKSDKEMVLQQLAIEMMHNRDDTDAAADDAYRIEISREKALAWIEPRITRFQSSAARKATAVQVLDYLVERTGLLREPAKDLIDFPHRTFQEYLAACAAGADSQEAMLARQADDDQWHETIMLAAGTSTGGVGFGRKLIDNLIKRGERHQSTKDRSQKIRKTCFALALGCLENLRQQDEDLRESVLSHLEELVPPRNDGDARILSVAGDAAVSHLSYQAWKDENTATIAACARALRMIGTTEALKAVARGYAMDSRQAVVAEVCRTGAFPYETIPLVAEHVRKTGELPHFVEANDVTLVLGLPDLKRLELDVSEAKGLDKLGQLNSVTNLDLERVSEKSNFVYNLPLSIKAMRLSGSALPHGGWISRLNNLTSASLIGMSDYDVGRVIDEALELEDLSIVASDFESVTSINRLALLRDLYLAGLSDMRDVSNLATHESLRRLVIEDCPLISRFPLDDGFEQLEKLQIEQPRGDTRITGRLPSNSSLSTLVLSDIGAIDDLSAFEDLSTIECLELSDCLGIRDVSALTGMTKLRELDLSSLNLLTAVSLPAEHIDRISLSAVSSLTNDSFQGGLTNASAVNIERCVRLESVDFVRNSTRLASLRLAMMPRISSLRALSGLSGLTSLELIDCDGIDSLQYVQHLPIEELTLVSMDNIRDPQVIGALKKLRSLTIVNCAGITDIGFAVSLPDLETIWLHPQDGSVHVPESLLPKITRMPFSRAMYYRQRKPWWREAAWTIHDAGVPNHYRRYHRARPYRWVGGRVV